MSLADRYPANNPPKPEVYYPPLRKILHAEIERRLHYFNGNATKAAISLGISRATMLRKMKEFGIVRQFRNRPADDE